MGNQFDWTTCMYCQDKFGTPPYISEIILYGPPCMLSTIAEIQKGQGLGSGYKWFAGLVSRVCMAGLVFRVCMGVWIIPLKGPNIMYTSVPLRRLGLPEQAKGWLFRGLCLPYRHHAVLKILQVLATSLPENFQKWGKKFKDQVGFEPMTTAPPVPALRHSAN